MVNDHAGALEAAASFRRACHSARLSASTSVAPGEKRSANGRSFQVTSRTRPASSGSASIIGKSTQSAACDMASSHRSQANIISITVAALLTIAVIAARVPSALAAPPPEGSEDWKIMAPFKDWIRDQKQPAGSGGSCCDWSDGRPVEAEIRGQHWWAHVTPAHWPGIADRWIEIPDERVNKGRNPIGLPILWLAVPHEWIGGRAYMSPMEGPVDNSRPPFVYCFYPPDGT